MCQEKPSILMAEYWMIALELTSLAAKIEFEKFQNADTF
jgi:hypothetical protein